MTSRQNQTAILRNAHHVIRRHGTHYTRRRNVCLASPSERYANGKLSTKPLVPDWSQSTADTAMSARHRKGPDQRDVSFYPNPDLSSPVDFLAMAACNRHDISNMCMEVRAAIDHSTSSQQTVQSRREIVVTAAIDGCVPHDCAKPISLLVIDICEVEDGA